MRLEIGSDERAHLGNNSFLNNHLRDALELGFQIMSCPKVAGLKNQDLNKEDFLPITTDIADLFGEVVRKVEAAGGRIAWFKNISRRYADFPEKWQDGLKNIPDNSRGEIADAVAEWADGDMVCAHVAYGNHYICTRDSAQKAGKDSVFSTENRDWLEREYSVKFITPEELAVLLENEPA